MKKVSDYQIKSGGVITRLNALDFAKKLGAKFDNDQKLLEVNLKVKNLAPKTSQLGQL